MPDVKNINNLTYKEWLEGAVNPPPDFSHWPCLYDYWRMGEPVAWALHCFNKSSRAQHEAREAIRRAPKPHP